jgi:hypothetical protein
MDSFAINCHAENHHWTRLSGLPTAVVRGVVKEMEVLRVCDLCESERRDTYILPTFALKKRKYTYVQGYKIKTAKGDSRPGRSAYRAVLLAREFKDVIS